MRTVTPRLQVLLVAAEVVPAKNASSPLERAGYRRRRDDVLDELGIAMQGGSERRRAEELFDLLVASLYVLGMALCTENEPAYVHTKASRHVEHWLTALLQLTAVTS